MSANFDIRKNLSHEEQDCRKFETAVHDYMKSVVFLTYEACHTIHHVTDDIMNEDKMARDMISLAMDVHEFSTVVIKFYKSFMVNEVHELFCDVFFVRLSRFLLFS